MKQVKNRIKNICLSALLGWNGKTDSPEAKNRKSGFLGDVLLGLETLNFGTDGSSE